MKRALPSEIARVTAKIHQLEGEVTQLEQCKDDVELNLFEGFEEAGVGDGLTGNRQNLAAWRRLNEFRSDIADSKKSIELESMRVQHQIMKLRESKQWLTDMSITANAVQTDQNPMEQNRLIRDFKGYLRKKIGIEKLE